MSTPNSTSQCANCLSQECLAGLRFLEINVLHRTLFNLLLASPIAIAVGAVIGTICLLKILQIISSASMLRTISTYQDILGSVNLKAALSLAAGGLVYFGVVSATQLLQLGVLVLSLRNLGQQNLLNLNHPLGRTIG